MSETNFSEVNKLSLAVAIILVALIINKVLSPWFLLLIILM